MEICLNNPFRVLGLTGAANEREITKRVSDLLIYAEMHKQKDYDLDLGFIQPIVRTPESIQEAKKKIEQIEEKLFNSLFWLWNNSSVDQLAVDFLKESNINKAIEILVKGTKEGLNVKNYTSHLNLAVLYLLQYRSNGTINKNSLKNALSIIGKLFSSQFFLSIVSKDIQHANQETINKLVTRFINAVLVETEKELAPSEIIDFLKDFDDEFKDIVIRKYTSKQIADIENEIEITKNKRLNDAKKTNKFGNALFNKVKKDLDYLEAILTRSSIQYEMIADKVAEEILLCSIAFFNHYQENFEFDPGEETIKLINLVREIGVGASIIKRINDNLPIIQEWIENKPERDAYTKCWYCRIEKPAKLRSVKVPMHYVIKETPSFLDLLNLPRTIRYKYFDVEINRCQKCYDRQENSNVLGYTIGIVAIVFVVSIVVLHQMEKNADGGGILISILAAIAAGFIAYRSLINAELKKYGNIQCKSKTDYKDHPLIKKLKIEGWEFGSKPPNVQ